MSPERPVGTTPIVAWHEVPGLAPPPEEPSRRVRCDSRRCGHRFDDSMMGVIGVTKISNAKTATVAVSDRGRRTNSLEGTATARRKNFMFH